MKKNKVHLHLEDDLFDYACRVAAEYKISLTAALKVIIGQHKRYISCINPVTHTTNSGKVQ